MSIEERERIIADLWTEILGIPTPEPGARFFALGGDSITVVRFVALAGQRGLVYRVRDVLEDDELGSLARRAGDGQAAS